MCLSGCTCVCLAPGWLLRTTFCTPYWTKWQHCEETVVAKVLYLQASLSVSWCVSHVTILLLALLYALKVPNGLCMLQSFVVRQSGPLSSHPRLISLRRGWEWRSLSWWIACALEPMFSYYLPFIPPLPASSLAAHFLMFMADFDIPCVWRCLVPQRDTQCAGLHCYIAQLFIFPLAPEGSGHNLDMKPGRADMEGAPEATRCLFLTLFTPNLSFLALWVASATAHMRTHTHWHTYTEYSL